MKHSYTSILMAGALLLAPLSINALAETAMTTTDSGAAVSIAPGTKVAGKLEQPLDSGKNHDGDKFVLDLKPGIFSHHDLKGYKVEGHLANVQSAAKFHHKGSMSLIVDDLVSPAGATTPVTADVVSALKAKGHMMRNAALIAGGAIVGHHMAKKSGHKHGGLMGAAAGAAAVFALPGGNVQLSRGSEVTVKFD